MTGPDSVHIFIDANVALHFKRPDQIDWRALTCNSSAGWRADFFTENSNIEGSQSVAKIARSAHSRTTVPALAIWAAYAVAQLILDAGGALLFARISSVCNRAQSRWMFLGAQVTSFQVSGSGEYDKRSSIGPRD
jgi:hypothetical protein